MMSVTHTDFWNYRVVFKFSVISEVLVQPPHLVQIANAVVAYIHANENVAFICLLFPTL